jgi:hypothetical protein
MCRLRVLHHKSCSTIETNTTAIIATTTSLGVPWRFPKIRGEGFDRSAFRRAWTIWRVGCPDQNVPSIARVAAGAFGFLTLIQVFDGSLIFVTEPVSDCNVGAQSQTDEEEH